MPGGPVNNRAATGHAALRSVLLVANVRHPPRGRSLDPRPPGPPGRRRGPRANVARRAGWGGWGTRAVKSAAAGSDARVGNLGSAPRRRRCNPWAAWETTGRGRRDAGAGLGTCRRERRANHRASPAARGRRRRNVVRGDRGSRRPGRPQRAGRIHTGPGRVSRGTKGMAGLPRRSSSNRAAGVGGGPTCPAMRQPDGPRAGRGSRPNRAEAGVRAPKPMHRPSPK